MLCLRRSMYTSNPGPDGAARSSMTVAESRGATGAVPASAKSRARRARSVGRMNRDRPMMPSSGFADFGDQFDLHRGTQRQFGHADRAAGVPAGVPQDREEQFTGAVDHSGLAGEAGGAGDEAGNLDDPPDGGQAAGDRGHGGQGVQRAGPGQPRRLVLVYLRADLAGGQELTAGHRELPGGVDAGTRPHRRQVGRQGGGYLREGEAEGGQPLLRAAALAGWAHGRGRFM